MINNPFEEKRERPMTFLGVFKARDGVCLVADKRVIYNPTGRFEEDFDKIIEVKKDVAYVLFGHAVNFFTSIYPGTIEKTILDCVESGSDFYKTVAQISGDIKSIFKPLFITSGDKLGIFKEGGVISIFILLEPKVEIYTLRYIEPSDSGLPIKEHDDGYAFFCPLEEFRTEQFIINSGYEQKNKLKEVENKVIEIYNDICNETLFVGGDINMKSIKLK